MSTTALWCSPVQCGTHLSKSETRQPILSTVTSDLAPRISHLPEFQSSAELHTPVLKTANKDSGYSCLKSGIVCVYAAPETKALPPKQALPQAQSCFHVFEIDTKPKERRFDLELVKPKSAAELRTVANVYQALCRLQPSDIPFDAPIDKAAFGFVSHPRISNGQTQELSAHPMCTDLLTVIVGYFDWTPAKPVPRRPAIFQDMRSSIRLAFKSSQRTCHRCRPCGPKVAWNHAETISRLNQSSHGSLLQGVTRHSRGT